MKFSGLLSICLIFLFNSLQAQEIIGKFDLSDTSQVHILTTHTGDLLVGRVLSRDAEKTIFLFKDSNELEFLNADIKSIKVVENKERKFLERTQMDILANDHPEIEVGPGVKFNDTKKQHVLTTKRGNRYEGTLAGITDYGLEFRINRRILTFRFNRVAKITAKPGPDISDTTTEFQSEKFTEFPKADTPTSPTDSIDIDENFNLNDPFQKHTIETKRGDRFVGRVESIDSIEIVFKNKDDYYLNFQPNEVRKITVYTRPYRLKRSKYGDYLIISSNKSLPGGEDIISQNKILVMPTGFGLKEGEAEYRNIMALYNEVNYALSDNFSLGAGAVPLFVVNVLTLHANFHIDVNDYFHIGAGAYGLFAIEGTGSGEFATLPYIAMSIGSEKGFMNLSYNRWTDNYSPADLWGIGFSIKTGNHLRLWADIFIVDEVDYDNNNTFLLAGASWFNSYKKFDFGIGVLPGGGFDSTLIPFPSFGFTRKF